MEVGVAIEGFFRLAKKAADELLHPEQLLEKKRRDELMRRGADALRSLLMRRNAYEIELGNVENNLQRFQRDDLNVYLSTSVPVMGFMANGDFDVEYWHNALDPDKERKADLTFSAPTFTPVVEMYDEAENKEKFHHYPSEGFRIGNKTVVPFAKREARDRVQHGGLFFDGKGGFQILDYDQLTGKIKSQLEPDQRLMEANWYLSSQNKYDVLMRRNLQLPLPFNALGLLSSAEKPDKYFFITHSDKSDLLALKLLGESKVFSLPFNPTLSQVSAMAEAIAKREGYENWKLAGTEYAHGGLWMPTIDGDDLSHGIHRIDFRKRQVAQ